MKPFLEFANCFFCFPQLVWKIIIKLWGVDKIKVLTTVLLKYLISKSLHQLWATNCLHGVEFTVINCSEAWPYMVLLTFQIFRLLLFEQIVYCSVLVAFGFGEGTLRTWTKMSLDINFSPALSSYSIVWTFWNQNLLYNAYFPDLVWNIYWSILKSNIIII